MLRHSNITIAPNSLAEDLAGLISGSIGVAPILEEIAVCPDVLGDEALCRAMLAPVMRKYRNRIAAWLVYSTAWSVTRALAEIFVFAGALTEEQRWVREMLADREGQTQAEKDWWSRSNESLPVA
jgi:hypothetical protein